MIPPLPPHVDVFLQPPDPALLDAGHSECACGEARCTPVAVVSWIENGQEDSSHAGLACVADEATRAVQRNDATRPVAVEFATWLSVDATDDAFVTYRQFDYWVRLALIAPLGDPTPGSGRTWERRFLASEVVLAREIGQLVEVGVEPRTAHAYLTGTDEQRDAAFVFARVCPDVRMAVPA